MNKRLLAAVSLLVLGAPPAFASDLPLYAKAPPSPGFSWSWSGLYIGANAGWAWGRDAVSATPAFPSSGAPAGLLEDISGISAAASPTVNSSGFTGGVQAGWNVQVGSALLGLELDYGAFNLRGSNTGTYPLPGGSGSPALFFSPSTSSSTDWLFTARPRLGWSLKNWLIFVTGGFAATHENFNQSVPLLNSYVFNSAVSEGRPGWTAGAGLEYALSHNWSVKAEYLYLDFGTATSTTPGFQGSAITTSNHLTSSVARAGVNYKFDWGYLN